MLLSLFCTVQTNVLYIYYYYVIRIYFFFFTKSVQRGVFLPMRCFIDVFSVCEISHHIILIISTSVTTLHEYIKKKKKKLIEMFKKFPR